MDKQKIVSALHTRQSTTECIIMWFFLVGNAANLMRRVDWSVVYRGELQDGRLVAIKCLNQELWPAEEELLTEIKISTFYHMPILCHLLAIVLNPHT